MIDPMELDTAKQTPQGYYECAACGRRYRSSTIPDRCAMCGAASAGKPRAAAGRNVEPITEKFRLAVERAKGNFRD